MIWLCLQIRKTILETRFASSESPDVDLAADSTTPSDTDETSATMPLSFGMNETSVGEESSSDETENAEQDTEPVAATDDRSDGEDPPHVPGEILVIMGDASSRSKIEQNLSTLSMEVEDTVGRALVVENPDEKTVEEAIQEAEQLPNAAYAQPNFIYYLDQNTPKTPVSENISKPQLSACDSYIPNQWMFDTLEINDVWDFGIPNGSSQAVEMTMVTVLTSRESLPPLPIMG